MQHFLNTNALYSGEYTDEQRRDSSYHRRGKRAHVAFKVEKIILGRFRGDYVLRDESWSIRYVSRGGGQWSRGGTE